MPKINPRIKSIDVLLGLVPQKKALLNLPLPVPCRPRTPSSPFPRRPSVLSEAIRSDCMKATGSDLVESISEHGVLNPAIIRKIERDEDGFEYEMAGRS